MGSGLALAAALSYGIGDFLAGVGGRRSLPALIPLVIQATGVVFAGVAVLLFAGGSPTAGVLVWGALSGIGSGLGNAALVRGPRPRADERGGTGVGGPDRGIAGARRRDAW